AHVRAVAHIRVQVVEEQDQVAPRAVHRVRETPQDRAVREHLDLQSVRLAERERVDAAPVVECSEGTLHRLASVRPSINLWDRQNANSNTPTTMRVHHELNVPLKMTS